MALRVVTGGGLQGSTYNPQQTAPSTKLQNPAPVKVFQPAAPVKAVQPAAPVKVVQPAITAAEVQRRADIARQQIATALAAQKEATRKRVQGEVNTKIATNKTAFKLAVTNPVWNAKLTVHQKFKLPKIAQPEQTDYQKAYAAAYNKAMADVSSKTKTGKQNGWQKMWDKLTLGSDRRQSDARQYAEKQAQDQVNKSVSGYQTNLDAFLKTQAKRKAAVEGAKYLTKSQFDRAAKEYTDWETAEIAKLENMRASVNAQVDAYGAASSKPLTSKVARGASMFNRNVINGVPGHALGWVGKYTIGQGSKNVPSLVTAPARVGNWLGNLNTKDRTIYTEDQKSFNRANSNLNAWQASFNQRTWNNHPWVDVKPGKQADQILGAKVNALIKARQAIAKNDPHYDKRKLDYNYVMQQQLKTYNWRHRGLNSTLDIAADPAIALGYASKGARALKLGEKAAAGAKSTKLGGFASDLFGKAKNSKPGKAIAWLGADHKTLEQRRSDYVHQELDDIARKKPQVRKLLNIWQANKHDIKATEKAASDMLASTAFGGFSRKEVKFFQRYVNNNHDWLGLKNADKLAPESVQKIEGAATQWRQMFDTMIHKEHKAGIETPFRANYLPKYRKQYNLFRYTKPKKKGVGEPDWWFTKHQETQDILSKKRFVNSLAARSYHSKLASKDLPVLRDIVAGHKDIGYNIDRIQHVNDTIKPTKWEKLARPAGLPMRIWKKSVLLGRPAWYVNNELFNQLRGVAHGGLGFIKNQRGTGKYLEHIGANADARFAPSVANQMKKDIASSLSNEVGFGKLGNVATKQENRSRIALYRTFRQRGMSHEDAIKRLNKALFSYQTKNWERPLKTAVPFWHFQKNIAQASARMPFDTPLEAQFYNKTDRYQQQQFNKDFDTLIPELQKLGYSDTEIEAIRADQQKYFAGKLKIGGRYWNTPFNAFSEKSISQLGFNPFMAAAGETSDSVDSFNQKVTGQNASWWRRLASKFPQVDLGIQGGKALAQVAGRDKPRSSWIAQPGHEGYGLTKEKQGYDKSKSSYVSKMDASAKLGQNALAFAGVPRSMAFDKADLLQRKTLQKASASYFATDWDKITKDQGYDAMEAQQKALFKKYGMTPDDFYKGVLAKYDTEQTKQIKNMKEAAKKSNKSLFDQYGAQPKGTRNLWATNKLRELVKSGYFDKNPFLKSFDWINPDSVAKADKQSLVAEAIKTGNWSKYQAKYGKTAKQVAYEKAKASGNWDAFTKQYGVKSEKAKLYKEAKASGNWSKYAAKYGDKRKQSPYQYGGKFFKTQDSMDKYKSGDFWRKYAMASKSEKAKLMADNPQFNTRKDWTAAQWSAQKKADKQKLRSDLTKVAGFSAKLSGNYAAAEVKATKYLTGKQRTYRKRVKWA